MQHLFQTLNFIYEKQNYSHLFLIGLQEGLRGNYIPFQESEVGCPLMRMENLNILNDSNFCSEFSFD